MSLRDTVRPSLSEVLRGQGRGWSSEGGKKKDVGLKMAGKCECAGCIALSADGSSLFRENCKGWTAAVIRITHDVCIL